MRPCGAREGERKRRVERTTTVQSGFLCWRRRLGTTDMKASIQHVTVRHSETTGKESAKKV